MARGTDHANMISFYPSLGLKQGHVNTMHVYGFPWYEFMNLDMNRANIVWPCSETMTLLITKHTALSEDELYH